jgi:glycosyltransferase involved in cell wall biosynthesis
MSPLKVLLVTYSFPPAGGVGVLRAASFARYLPGEDIRLDILTTRNASAVGADPTLLTDIPPEVTLHRTMTLDLPFGLKKRIKRMIAGNKRANSSQSAPAATAKPSFLKRTVQDLLLPDPQITWLPIVTRAASRIIRERTIELVLITVPPFSSTLLVKRLRKRFPNLAIVADFRDEWLTTAIDLFGVSRSDRARALARDAEADTVKHASAITMVSESARRQIRSRYPHEPKEKFQLIPNGFDSTRLAPATRIPGLAPGGTLLITHIGTVYRTTDPTWLAEALVSLPPEVKSRIKLRFIGHIEEPRFRESLAQLGAMVELKGFLPQQEALAAMQDTHYVLLVSHDLLNIGAKFYDYVGGRKPILATVHPDGELRRQMEDLRAGWWVGNHDVAGIRRLFIDAVARGQSLNSAFQPDSEKIAQYERKPLAQRCARLLHAIAATGALPTGEREPSLMHEAGD